MTKIGIIRHGSTQWNKEGRAQGNSDIPLDKDGLLEASKLAERLSKENWDIVYSSNLLRAKQTAEIIQQKIGDIELHFDPKLREVGGGEIEGTTEQERIIKWGSNWRDLDLGIERGDSVVKRALSIMEEITCKHNNKNILIVSHGSFIRHLLHEIVTPLIMEVSPKNTSITKLINTSNGWDCELYNCTVHLNEE